MAPDRISAALLALSLIGLASCSTKEPSPAATQDFGPPVRTSKTWSGSLSGKRVVLSPGHGYYYDTTLGAWTTQRPDCWGLVEDRHTGEIANDFLIPMLERAGALVLSCRERSRQVNEAVVDDSQGPPAYVETGTWSTTLAAGTGWNGSEYRYADVSPLETATATWTPDLPAGGEYPVWVWFRASSNRSPAALFRVAHKGGTTEVSVDQRVFGSRWFHLGDYWFEAGSAGTVTLSNRSDGVGEVVIADAVRFGGGMGSLERGGWASGQPRWMECARYWTEFMGAPQSVWLITGVDRTDDITCRAHFADWMENEWQGQGGAVYLSLHTNAAATPNTGTGTDTFIHDTSPSPGSAEFQEALHTQVIQDVRALWKSDWVDRGRKTANFGELRETDDMPAVLIEMAFHDTQTPDNDFLHEDEFRRDVARALYKGISKYLNPGGAITPLPPTHLSVRSLSAGRMQIAWRARTDPLEPSAVPDRWVVYGSLDGRAFDNGRLVSAATSVEIGNLEPGVVYYFRVAAVNDGGESLPTEVLCARARGTEGVSTLLVNGFDRLDRFVTIRRRENTRDYVRQHASSIVSSRDLYFDSASNEAVADGDVDLSGYMLVDWILGEESTSDETFSDSEQAMVRSFLLGGGGLLVSGAEAAWDLGEKGSVSDHAFLSDVLKASYVLDRPGAGVYSAEPVAGTIFEGLGVITFDDGTHGTFDVDWPDVLQAQGGSQAVINYSGGSGYAAGIAWDGGTQGRLVYLGFPLEAVYEGATREALFGRIVDFLLP